MNEDDFKHFAKGEEDLSYFVNHIFSASFDHFILGNHVNETARFLQANPKTIRVSARDHFKSTSLYAHFMWELLYKPGMEAHYFSFNASMSAYHLAKLKALISKNRFFNEIKDCKPTAEGVIKYQSGGQYSTLTPSGLLEFKRGIHAPRIYVDDPFQDPTSKLNPILVKKINRIFSTEIMDMPTREGELHVVGTPQSVHDFYFDKNITKRFNVMVLPAVKNELNKEVLWPEHMNFEELAMRRKERGEKIFNQEYMCSPFWTEQAWFSRDKLMAAVDPNLQILQNDKTKNRVVLGWDIGKKVHPAHVAIFKNLGGKWIQVYHKFLEGWSYTRQKDFVNALCDDFQVDIGVYDATRGELETFVENNELHQNLEPMIFSNKTKHDMAVNFEKMVENHEVALLNDERMLNQILVVDNDLNALETPEGHGDSFWSVAMALWGASRLSDSGIGEFL